jgi:two-component system response regulator HydG
MALLSFTIDDRPLFVHQLKPGRTLIGRADTADVALPHEMVSRVHFIVSQRDGQWWVQDRSRHGTRLNGEPVDKTFLSHDDKIDFGPYTAQIELQPSLDDAGITATQTPRPLANHEALVAADGTGTSAIRSQVRLLDGPHQGRTFELRHARVRLGGQGAPIVLDPETDETLAMLRVVRGRVLVEPGTGTVMLEGERVREVTPMLAGETLSVNGTTLTIESYTRLDGGEGPESFGEMVGHSAPLRQVFRQLERVAVHEHPLLLGGESGTGKELAARGVHAAGPRHAGPFVPINCAALSENLFESELFGHEKGAFTGASQRRDGAFHEADGGILFLDELGELQPSVQAKLLRALESGEVRRVGGKTPSFPDVRVIAATNRNLAEEVQAQRFREDLYWRMAVLHIELPPLREHLQDLPVLAETLLKRRHPDAHLTPDAVRVMSQHNWPGNVRELRNVLTRAYVMTGPEIHGHHLVFDGPALSSASPPNIPLSREEELQRIREALEQARGNKAAAARLLGMPRTSFLYRLERLTEEEA